MRNCTLYIVLFVFGILISCKKEEEKPKVNYDPNSKSQIKTLIDTSKVFIADLPIHMEGTNMLLYPIGDLNYSKRTNYGSSRGNGSISYTVSNYGQYEITGYLNNVKFQEIGKDSIYSLTNKAVVIQTVSYLKEHAAKTRQQILVYVLEDMDTNKDSKLDESDIKALYISTIDGAKFTKLTPDFQDLIDWKYLPIKNSIYFRTVEDTNKNGEMDSSDKIYYYVLNLLNKDWNIEMINPVD